MAKTYAGIIARWSDAELLRYADDASDITLTQAQAQAVEEACEDEIERRAYDESDPSA